MLGAELGQKFGSLRVFRVGSAMLLAAIDLDRANFVSHKRLQDVMTGTTATPEQIAEAVRINVDSRRRALKLSFLLLGSVVLLVIVPVGRLPNYGRGRGPP